MFGGNGVNGVHISRLAIQAHRHDGAGAWRDGRLDLRGINQAGVGLHIHPHRRAAQQHNHFGCCCKGKRRGDDFIARLQVQRHEADEQGLGTAGYGDAVPGACARGQRGFQLGHFRPHDVLAVLQHVLHALGNACLQCGILGFEVDEFHASPSFKVCLQAPRHSSSVMLRHASTSLHPSLCQSRLQSDLPVTQAIAVASVRAKGFALAV